MEYITELINEIKKRGRAMKPATAEQMKELKRITGERKLPQAYLEFMSVMGNQTDHCFMVGESCFMNEIFDLKEGAMELLEENESKHILTDNDFVFWMSQGCAFCYFKLNEGENPPIYFYNEDGTDQCLRVAFSLTDFLMNHLKHKKDTFKPK